MLDKLSLVHIYYNIIYIAKVKVKLTKNYSFVFERRFCIFYIRFFFSPHLALLFILLTEFRSISLSPAPLAPLATSHHTVTVSLLVLPSLL